MRLMLPAAALLLIAAAPPPAPPAPAEPVTETIHGRQVTDEYRWMESGKDPRWMPHLKAQAAHSRAVLDSLPGRAALLRDIAARSGALPAVTAVRMSGDVMVWQERPAGAEDFRLMARAGKSQAPVTLFEVTPGQTGAEVIDSWSISPDGKWVALESSVRGSERSGVSLIETATGVRRPLRIADAGWVQWLPDSSGFVYNRYIGEHGTPSYLVNNEARFHRIASGEDRKLTTRGLAEVAVRPEQFANVLTSRNSQHAFLGVRDGRSEFALYRAPLAAALDGSARWQRVADFGDTVTDAAVAGDDLYLTTKKTNPNGQLLRLDAAAPDLGRATIVTLSGNPVIDGITATKTGVLVRTIEGGVAGLWFVPKTGSARRITLPFDGSLGFLETDPNKDDALLSLAGWFKPPVVYHLAENGDLHDIGFMPELPFDTSAYVATRGMARSHDGTMVPYTMLTSSKAPANGPRPVLLDAYGSYGLSQLPRSRLTYLPFLDRGGVYVVANVRGGGEFGRAWHYAGKAETKANTWLDAIAVGEKLVADRIASPATMTLIGTSAGGVTVGQAINARPDLFSGAIANVGFMNPTRYVSEQNYADIEEWGGPIADARTFEVMRALDPYANIKKGVRYPATLVVSGLNDPRAATFHSAKYAARLKAASTSGEPVLLRLDFDAGHGAGFGSSRSQADAVMADMLGFVLWQAGVPEFQPAR
nr:prolyl oligopeptidase family serine peptidase [uncultured Sphingomonas sp.]